MITPNPVQEKKSFSKMFKSLYLQFSATHYTAEVDGRINCEGRILQMLYILVKDKLFMFHGSLFCHLQNNNRWIECPFVENPEA